MSARGRHEHPATRWWTITGDPWLDTVLIMVAVLVTVGLMCASMLADAGWLVCLPSCVRPTTAQCHCGACHETFGGAGGFDRHRSHGECLSPEAIGLVRDDRGVWRRLIGAAHPMAQRRRAQEGEQGTAGGPVPTMGVDAAGEAHRDAECANPRDASPEHPRVIHGQDAAMDNRPAGKLPSAAKSPGQSLINSPGASEAVTVVDG